MRTRTRSDGHGGAPRNTMLKPQTATPAPTEDEASLKLLAMIFAILAVLYFAKAIFIPFAFALALSFILTPLATALQRIHLGRVFSVMISMTLLMAVAGALCWLVATQLLEVVEHLPAYRENIDNRVRGLRAPATGAVGRVEKSVQEIGKELSQPVQPPPSVKRRAVPTAEAPMPVQVVTPDPAPVEYLSRLTRPFLEPLGLLGFVLILTVFILIKREDLRNRLVRLVGVSQLNTTTQAIDDATRRISRYLVLQVAVNGLMGIALWAGLMWIGVPYAGLWGVIAAILRLVPYVGILSAAILPVALSLAVFDGWWRPALVLLLFFVMEMIVGNFIEPWLYGAHTGISSLGLLVSAIFWTILWGYPGLILSTPLTVCVVVLGRYVPQLSFLHIALGDEDVLTTEIQLYQRLLAMDHAEAREVVDEFLKEKRLVDLYEEVVIPVLILAEKERHRGTLEPVRDEFMFLCLNEIIAEMAGQPEGKDAELVNPAEIGEHPGRVFVIPIKDAGDETSGALFAQLLEREGAAVITLPIGSTDGLEVLEPGPDDWICVSALPPFAFAAAAKTCAQLRRQYPEVKIMAGIWGYPDGKESLLRKLESTSRVMVATTLAKGLELTIGVKVAPEEPVEVGV